MQIKQELPPNYDLIKLAVNPPPDAIFCFGDTVYNLSGQDIPEDVLHHESIHTKQQGKDIEGWWNKWITDPVFRYNQELEAYTNQFKFIKERYNAKAQKEALTDLAQNLKEHYALHLNLQEIESKIRNGVKNL